MAAWWRHARIRMRALGAAWRGNRDLADRLLEEDARRIRDEKRG